MKLIKSMIVITTALAAMIGYAGDSAPFRLDTVTTSTSPAVGSLLISWDASWIGGRSDATVVIRDNGIEAKRTTGVGEYLHTLTSVGRNELTYTTYIDGVAQSEVYSVAVYAQSNRVAFAANGGNVSEQTRWVVKGAVIGVLPTPTRTGYTFAGWWTAASGGTQITSATKVTANVTYYAHWVADGLATKCTVIFDVNGNGALRDEEVTRKVVKNAAVGELPTPMVPNLAYSGFGEFLGWFTAKTGGAQIAADTIVTKDVTYYAHWQLDDYGDDYLVGHWYGIEGSGCEVAPFEDVRRYAEREHVPLVVVFGHAGCSWCYRYIQPAIDGLTEDSSRNAVFFDFYAQTRDELMESSAYRWANEIAPGSGAVSWPEAFLYWVRPDGRKIWRSRHYSQLVNGERRSMRTIEDVESIVDELDIYRYIYLNRNEDEYPKADLLTLPLGDGLYQLPTLEWEEEGRKSFDGWYTAASGGRKVTSISAGYDDMVLYAHWRNWDGAAYVTVRTMPGQETLGKVTGGNSNFKSGQKVVVRATANKGAAFMGWYLNGEYVAYTPSYTYVATGDAATLEAEFIASADDYIYVTGTNMHLGVHEQVDGDVFEFFDSESASMATMKITGLPPGVKFNSVAGTISGAPTKAGVYYVTCAVANANGYKQSAISVWTVGYADNGDYDNIGMDWDNLENQACYDEETGEYALLEWVTGEEMRFVLDGVIRDYEYTVTAISGLPAGLKASKCPYNATCNYMFCEGTPTKAGKYTITVTAKSMRDGRTTRKAVKTIIVRDAGSRYLDVVSVDSERGTVTGAGVYSVGTSARISAKPARGYYFAGWYDDSEEPFYNTASGEFQRASDSVVVRAGTPGLMAKFVSKEEDYVYFDSDDRWEVDTSGWGAYLSFGVYSETPAKVTAKGMPSGMKFTQRGDRCEIVCSDTSKLKPGTSDVVFTAKTATGVTELHVLRIVVPNLQSWVFDGLDYSDSAYRLTLGVSDVCLYAWMSAEYDSSYTISASALPPGLKFMARDGVLSLHGTPTKAGTYTVTLTAKSRWGTEKATITITVDPLPNYAIGTFNGVLMDSGGNVAGLVTLTASANGKISAKVVAGPSNGEVSTHSYSSNGWNCESDGFFDAYFYKSSTGEYCMLTLEPGHDWNDAGQMTGYCSIGGEEYDVMFMQRDPIKSGVWEAKDIAANLARSGTYSLVCDYFGGEMRYPEYSESSNLQLKVNKTTGVVLLAGKLSSSSVSATAPLMFDDDGAFVVFYAPVNEKWCAMTPNGIGKCYTKRVYYPFTFHF